MKKNTRRLAEEMTVEEALAYIKQLGETGKCPECGSSLSVDDFSNDPWSHTYIPGLPGYFEIFCGREECEFSVLFTEDFGAYQQKQDRAFRIGTHVGGVMEHPDFEWVDVETIYAKSRGEAIEKYKKIHPQEYWGIGEVDGRW